MLQCRSGKRTAQAALKIACDLVDEGMIDEKKAVLMIDPRNLDTLLHPQFDADKLKAATPIGKGLGASPGAACGKVVFSAEDAKAWAARKEKVVLVRLETSPEDIEGMKAAQGILTVRGGMTSHAAVVARGMGKCCVSGCGEIKMDEENKKFELAGKTYREGDCISIDGSTGKIYDGIIPTVDATIAGEFGRIMGWADKYRRLQVRTNADTPHDAAKARELGAQGIGLTRTEHMFFEGDRIAAFREMICSDTVEERVAALAKLEPMQQSDFEGIYEAMEGCPVTIRYLDPPLHEFVPTEEADIELLAKDQGKSVEAIKNIIASLHEFNPMMGHRGCRLAVTYPEIAEMQVPEIMIPLVGEVKELKYVKDIVVKTADAVLAAAGSDMKYLVGTMIEIPRAALTADEIAKEAEFFSFGTNDLTQMTFGFSRDDAGKFLGAYYDKKRPFRPSRAAPGCLRRARRRSQLCGVLPQGWPRLRVLQPLPRSHRPSGRRSGRHQGRRVIKNAKQNHNAAAKAAALFFFVPFTARTGSVNSERPQSRTSRRASAACRHGGRG